MRHVLIYSPSRRLLVEGMQTDAGDVRITRLFHAIASLDDADKDRTEMPDVLTGYHAAAVIDAVERWLASTRKH